MTFPNIFSAEVANGIIDRINKLKNDTPALWGKMDVARMLAHCSVTYEMIYEDKHPAPKGFAKLLLKLFVKNIVVGVKPYPKNSRTAPAFLISDPRIFEIEKKRLIEFIQKTQQLGENYFDNKESLSFGKLSMEQWNNMMYKHLNHHLAQFGV